MEVSTSSEMASSEASAASEATASVPTSGVPTSACVARHDAPEEQDEHREDHEHATLHG
jgi:hypothetical protein